MKQFVQIRLKLLFLGLLFLCVQGYAQKQTKTFNEQFKVDNDAVLDINTSYADIQFETWDKNEVVVEAMIELDGATPEEAEAYFKNSGIKILGNSKTIEIKTYGSGLWSGAHKMNFNFKDFEFPELPPMPNMEEIMMNIEIPDLPPMPPMPPLPPMPDIKFDYEAYKKDGEKYMKKWQKEFDKNFGKEYQESMQVWGEEYAARMEAKKDLIDERRAAMEERREEMEEQREGMKEQREEMREQMQEARKQASEDRERALKEAMEVREKALFEQRNNNQPSIFIMDAEGESRNFKVKKTIKIKMPKSATLKMNVRHGEVKLAANTKNINATLSYARLHASSIEGAQTQINAAYSPVKVAQWKYGNLKTSYSDEVELDAVTQLNLTATSSQVIIHKLLNSLEGSNNLGAIHIVAIDPGFKQIELKLQNAELDCTLPKVPVKVNASNTYSEFAFPASWALKAQKTGGETVYTGTSLKGTATKTLVLKSAYSDIILR